MVDIFLFYQANYADPDQTAQKQSDLGLHCLLKPVCYHTCFWSGVSESLVMEVRMTHICSDLFIEIKGYGYLHVHSVHEIILIFLLLDLMHADLRLFRENKEVGI